MSLLKNFCTYQDFPATVATWRKDAPLGSLGSSALHIWFYLETISSFP